MRGTRPIARFDRWFRGTWGVMQILNRLEQAHGLDPVSDKLQSAVYAAAKPQALRDLLHGTWLGHPLHPVLVQLPVGAFVSSAILDLLPGTRAASTTLVGVGTASSAPAIAAGLADWSQMTRDRRRVGLVHAAANTVALGLYAASLVARLRGRTARGKLLGFAGLSAAGLGAYLGGHLAYAQAGGTNQAAPDVVRIPEDWTAAGSLASLPEGKPAVRTVGDVPVLLYRLGGQVTAMMERCGHETGPLGEGEVVGSGRDACVVCPWHGSTFRLVDGVAVHGPAANDQPVLRTRVRDGMVEVSQP
jgi:nitrite reductase/ring-hydroxylating ferredoxin subunit/uncharacterized membrane protein